MPLLKCEHPDISSSSRRNKHRRNPGPAQPAKLTRARTCRGQQNIDFDSHGSFCDAVSRAPATALSHVTSSVLGREACSWTTNRHEKAQGRQCVTQPPPGDCMTVKTRANARAEGTGIWGYGREFASAQAPGTRAVTGRACLQLKAVRAASPLRVLRRSTCRSNGDAARSFLFGPSIYFANKRRCLSFVNLVFLFEIYSMKFILYTHTHGRNPEPTHSP